eukprot:g3803.t1
MAECLGKKPADGSAWDKLVEELNGHAAFAADGGDGGRDSSYSMALFGPRDALDLAVRVVASSLFAEPDGGGVLYVDLAEAGLQAAASRQDGSAIADLQGRLERQLGACPKQSLVVLDHVEAMRGGGAKVTALNAFLEAMNKERPILFMDKGNRQVSAAGTVFVLLFEADDTSSIKKQASWQRSV